MSLSASLVGIGIVQAILYLLFVRFIDLYERESLRYVIPVFIWGFAVATTVSGISKSIGYGRVYDFRPYTDINLPTPSRRLRRGTL